MVATTRSKGTLMLSLKVSKAGVTKRTKVTSSVTKALKSKAVVRHKPTAPAATEPIVTSYFKDDVPLSRPASPTATNAPLVSPSAPFTVLPHASAPTSTTSDILKEGIAHLLKVEPKFTPLIEQHECTVFSKEGLSEIVDPFHSLISGIISQQISGAAARSVKARFIDLFAEGLEKEGLSFPTPAMVLNCSKEKLRTAGLSVRKAEYAHSLAEKFTSGGLSADILSSANDEEIVQKLVEVRGIGAWSAEMFLMFGLKRMDVFSIGDLGIQRGQAVIAGRDVSKLKAKGKGKWKYMSEEDMIKHSEPFRPYRSLYMWYLWKASDVSVESFKSETASKKTSVKAPKGKGKTKE